MFTEAEARYLSSTLQLGPHQVQHISSLRTCALSSGRINQRSHDENYGLFTVFNRLTGLRRYRPGWRSGFLSDCPLGLARLPAWSRSLARIVK